MSLYFVHALYFSLLFAMFLVWFVGVIRWFRSK